MNHKLTYISTEPIDKFTSDDIFRKRCQKFDDEAFARILQFEQNHSPLTIKNFKTTYISSNDRTSDDIFRKRCKKFDDEAAIRIANLERNVDNKFDILKK
jgi:hypothetical protein